MIGYILGLHRGIWGLCRDDEKENGNYGIGYMVYRLSGPFSSSDYKR